MLGDYAWYMLYRVISLFPQSAPVEPTDSLKSLIAESSLSQADVAKMYKVFQSLHRQEVLRSYHRFRTSAISVGSMINIIPANREYVQILLSNVLQLGGCYEYLDWNHFLYVTIRFSSLTKVEMCQLMFLIIVRESRGLDVHYLTSTQLDRFYQMYRSSEVPRTMNCSTIHFSNFPLSRYYITDFVEICFLYAQLLNPLIYLQRQFQRVLPNVKFWENHENPTLVGNRKVGMDFFLIKKSQINLLSETPFQETNDLLLLASEIIHNKVAESGTRVGGWGSIFASPPSDKNNYERNLELAFLSKSRTSFKAPTTIYGSLDQTSLIKN